MIDASVHQNKLNCIVNLIRDIIVEVLYRCVLSSKIYSTRTSRNFISRYINSLRKNMLSTKIRGGP